MSKLPYVGFPSDEIHTIVTLLIPITEIDGKYKDALTKHLRQCGIVNGYVEAELNSETKNIFRVKYSPAAKSDRTKPALTDARNKLGKEINSWFLKNVKP